MTPSRRWGYPDRCLHPDSHPSTPVLCNAEHDDIDWPVHVVLPRLTRSTSATPSVHEALGDKILLNCQVVWKQEQQLAIAEGSWGRRGRGDSVGSVIGSQVGGPCILVRGTLSPRDISEQDIHTDTLMSIQPLSVPESVNR